MLDKKANALSAFQVARSHAQVTRNFAQACLEKDSMLGKYPDDFELVAIAEVSDEVDPENDYQVAPMKLEVVVTARAVVDMQSRQDPAQLSLIKEA